MGRRRKPLGRGWRTVRNFAALAAAAGLCWLLARAPVWLVEGKVRREAAEQGVPGACMEVLWKGDLPCVPLGGGGAPFPGMDSVPAVLARGGGRLWLGYMGSYEGEIYLSGVATRPDTGGGALAAFFDPHSWSYDGNALEEWLAELQTALGGEGTR